MFIIDLENNKVIIKNDKFNDKFNSEYGEFTYKNIKVFIKYEQINIDSKELKEKVLKIINTYGELSEPKGDDTCPSI